MAISIFPVRMATPSHLRFVPAAIIIVEQRCGNPASRHPADWTSADFFTLNSTGKPAAVFEVAANQSPSGPKVGLCASLSRQAPLAVKTYCPSNREVHPLPCFMIVVSVEKYLHTVIFPCILSPDQPPPCRSRRYHRSHRQPHRLRPHREPPKPRNHDRRSPRYHRPNRDHRHR